MAIIGKRKSAFIETEVDDEVVIVSLDRGQFFSLSGTGLEVWRKLDGSRSREQVLDELAAEYDVGRETIAGDVDAFLAEVEAAGFLEMAPEGL